MVMNGIHCSLVLTHIMDITKNCSQRMTIRLLFDKREYQMREKYIWDFKANEGIDAFY